MATLSRQYLNDRRLDRRYPVKVALEYRIVIRKRKVVTGIGGTVDISSGGVLIQTANSLPRGVTVELVIAWPARLNHTVALKLHVTGQTVRTEGSCTAVVIRRHMFRTSGTPIHAGR